MKSSLPVVLISLSLVNIIAAFSCRSNVTNPEVNELFYFPDKNVYYDVKSSNYYYSIDSAKSWDSLAFKGSDYGSSLGAKVELGRSVPRPWLNNDSHRNAHNAGLLNLVNSRTILLAREDSLRRIKPVTAARTKPVIVKEEEVSEPPKKGLKKFFNKIFGKKKQKKEE